MVIKMACGLSKPANAERFANECYGASLIHVSQIRVIPDEVMCSEFNGSKSNKENILTNKGVE